MWNPSGPSFSWPFPQSGASTGTNSDFFCSFVVSGLSSDLLAILDVILDGSVLGMEIKALLLNANEATPLPPDTSLDTLNHFFSPHVSSPQCCLHVSDYTPVTSVSASVSLTGLLWQAGMSPDVCTVLYLCKQPLLPGKLISS